MRESLARAVRKRARDRCEYCRLTQEFDPIPFEIDHIIARKHGGSTSLDNLAFSCLHCNVHKGPNIAGIDPVSNKIVPLFHPRRHVWSRHFLWNGPILVGRTAAGRATVSVLSINDHKFVIMRRALVEAGLFP